MFNYGWLICYCLFWLVGDLIVFFCFVCVDGCLMVCSPLVWLWWLFSFWLVVWMFDGFGLLYCSSLPVYLIVLICCDIVYRCVVLFGCVGLLDLFCLYVWCLIYVCLGVWLIVLLLVWFGLDWIVVYFCLCW